jgi:hypothetical protein
MRLKTSSISRRLVLLAVVTGAVAAGIVVVHALRGHRVPTGPPSITTTALGDFTFDPRNGTIADVPPPLRDLDGRRVAVIGEMWMPTGEDGQWMLTKVSGRDSHRPPRVQEFVFCRAPTTVPYRGGVVRATGVMHVNAVHRDGEVQELFSLDVDDFQPVRESN